MPNLPLDFAVAEIARERRVQMAYADHPGSGIPAAD
jgi:hypothetical protein